MIVGFVLGIILILVSIPLLIWKIPPNMVYGFRSPKTLKPGNEVIWYKANTFMAKTFTICGIVEIILAYFTIDSDSLPQAFDWTLVISIMLIPFVGVVITALYVKKL